MAFMPTKKIQTRKIPSHSIHLLMISIVGREFPLAVEKAHEVSAADTLHRVIHVSLSAAILREKAIYSMYSLFCVLKSKHTDGNVCTFQTYVRPNEKLPQLRLVQETRHGPSRNQSKHLNRKLIMRCFSFCVIVLLHVVLRAL